MLKKENNSDKSVLIFFFHIWLNSLKLFSEYWVNIKIESKCDTENQTIKKNNNKNKNINVA